MNLYVHTKGDVTGRRSGRTLTFLRHAITTCKRDSLDGCMCIRETNRNLTLSSFWKYSRRNETGFSGRPTHNWTMQSFKTCWMLCRCTYSSHSRKLCSSSRFAAILLCPNHEDHEHRTASVSNTATYLFFAPFPCIAVAPVARSATHYHLYFLQVHCNCIVHLVHRESPCLAYLFSNLPISARTQAAGSMHAPISSRHKRYTHVHILHMYIGIHTSVDCWHGASTWKRDTHCLAASRSAHNHSRQTLGIR